MCHKGIKKIRAPARHFLYIPVNQRKHLMNAYYLAEFVYCPEVWMKHNRILNHPTKGLHERELRLVYSNFSSAFSELLIKDKPVTINRHKLQTLEYFQSQK